MNWVGGIVSGVGAGLNVAAAHRRAKAVAGVNRKIKRATEQYGAQRFETSDNLRRVLESIGAGRGDIQDQFLGRRLDPGRDLAAEQAEQLRMDAAQSGMERALAAVAPPPGAYDATQATGAGRESMAINQAQHEPMLANLMDQLAAAGYFEGLASYDTQSGQQRDMGLAPLSQAQLLNQLLTGVRQGDQKLSFEDRMRQLGVAMEKAQSKGRGLALMGTILQNIGTGISGGSNYQIPQNPSNPGAPIPGSGQPAGGAAYQAPFAPPAGTGGFNPWQPVAGEVYGPPPAASGPVTIWDAAGIPPPQG